jgi:hypothetical protein
MTTEDAPVVNRILPETTAECRGKCRLGNVQKKCHVLLFVMGFIEYGFNLGAAHNTILLIVVVLIFI